MFSLLKTSGLPVYVKEEDNLLAFLAPLVYNRFSRKTVRDMDGLLQNGAGAAPDEPYYDVYRNIRFAEHEAQLAADTYCYDITYIMPGQVNGECKKTSGHYHGYNPTHTNTYPEVYEVLKGTAIYLLQRADNFEGDPAQLKIDDLYIVKVEAGQSIIIPPNYGHCSVNGGDGPMLFSNLAYAAGKVNYDPVRHYSGMTYFVRRENGRNSFVRNENYPAAAVPAPKFALVKENARLGIEFGKPVYQNYIEHPERFHFLGNPDGYENEIMNMLHVVDTL